MYQLVHLLATHFQSSEITLTYMLAVRQVLLCFVNQAYRKLWT
mgnify:CR=1 FL=1